MKGYFSKSMIFVGCFIVLPMVAVYPYPQKGDEYVVIYGETPAFHVLSAVQDYWKTGNPSVLTNDDVYYYMRRLVEAINAFSDDVEKNEVSRLAKNTFEEILAEFSDALTSERKKQAIRKIEAAQKKARELRDFVRLKHEQELGLAPVEAEEAVIGKSHVASSYDLLPQTNESPNGQTLSARGRQGAVRGRRPVATVSASKQRPPIAPKPKMIKKGQTSSGNVKDLIRTFENR